MQKILSLVLLSTLTTMVYAQAPALPTSSSTTQIVITISILVGIFIIYKKMFQKSNLPQLTVGNSMIKKDYSQAIFIAKLVSFIGWIAVTFGVIGVLSIFGGAESIFREVGTTAGVIAFVVSFASSIMVALFGLVLIVVGQTARATMDNANYSAAILEEMKKLNAGTQVQDE